MRATFLSACGIALLFGSICRPRRAQMFVQNKTSQALTPRPTPYCWSDIVALIAAGPFYEWMHIKGPCRSRDRML
jgi:hypothetical protein